MAPAWHTGSELVVGDGGALNGAPDQVTIQTVGQVAAFEPVGPLPQVAREMLGDDPMMGADQPGFHFAEQRVDDREGLCCRLGSGGPRMNAFCERHKDSIRSDTTPLTESCPTG
jgi:hypothetical protein